MKDQEQSIQGQDLELVSAAHVDHQAAAAIPSHQQFEPKESWGGWVAKHSKTPFGILVTASTSVILSTATVNPITSAVSSNAAFFCALGYIVCKNHAVKAENKELENKIRVLRQYIQQKDINVDDVDKARKPKGWLNKFGFAETILSDPMTYCITIAVIVDVLNCLSVYLSLSKPASGDSSKSDLSLWEILSIPLGVCAPLLVIPQVIVAHNLRQYQEALNKELKELNQHLLDNAVELKEAVVQRDETITERQKTITAFETTVTQKNGIIAERDITIAGLKIDVAQRDETIMGLRSDIAKRDETIIRQKITIVEYEEVSQRYSQSSLLAQQWSDRHNEASQAKPIIYIHV